MRMLFGSPKTKDSWVNSLREMMDFKLRSFIERRKLSFELETKLKWVPEQNLNLEPHQSDLAFRCFTIAEANGETELPNALNQTY